MLKRDFKQNTNVIVGPNSIVLVDTLSTSVLVFSQCHSLEVMDS